MQTDFAAVVDPIFLTALDFIDRMERSQRLVVSDERAKLLRQVDEAEAKLGGGNEEWQYAKFAICAWVDSMLINAPWQGRGWWANNCLEKQYFGTRLAHAKFYEEARKAAALARKNALEVYYIAVVLGFRGLYNDPTAPQIAEQMKLPPTIEAWARETAMSLQLNMERENIIDNRRIGRGAKPLDGRSQLVNMSMIGTLLLAAAIAYFLFFFWPQFRDRAIDADSAQIHRTQIHTAIAARSISSFDFSSFDSLTERGMSE
jgi:type VI secretion system protein ImpK